MKKYDVLILGAGPSGLATSLNIKKQNPDLCIKVLDRVAHVEEKIGETVPGKISQAFKDLDLWDDFLKQNHLVSQGKSIDWGEANEVNALFEAKEASWHISRPQFDDWLVETCRERGIEVDFDCKIQNINVINNQIKFIKEESPQVCLFHYLVNATGNPKLIPDTETVTEDQLVVAYLFGKTSSKDTYTQITTSPNGWWYQCNTNEKSVVAFFTDSSYLKANRAIFIQDLQDDLPSNNSIKQLVNTCDPSSVLSWTSVKSHWSTSVGKNWIAVGDAALRYDPLSGQGIYKAFETAKLASFAITDALDGDESAFTKYSMLIKRIFESYFNQRQHYYNQVKTYPDSKFWKNRQTRISIEPQDNIEEIIDLNPQSKWLTSSQLTTIKRLTKSPISVEKIVCAIDDNGQSRLRSILGLQYLMNNQKQNQHEFRSTENEL